MSDVNVESKPGGPSYLYGALAEPEMGPPLVDVEVPLPARFVDAPEPVVVTEEMVAAEVVRIRAERQAQLDEEDRSWALARLQARPVPVAGVAAVWPDAPLRYPTGIHGGPMLVREPWEIDGEGVWYRNKMGRHFVSAPVWVTRRPKADDPTVEVVFRAGRKWKARRMHEIHTSAAVERLVRAGLKVADRSVPMRVDPGVAKAEWTPEGTKVTPGRAVSTIRPTDLLCEFLVDVSLAQAGW